LFFLDIFYKIRLKIFMSIEDEVRRISKLSKLKFSEAELGNFTRQFQSILNMVESLKNLSCEGVEPLKSISSENFRTRVDEIIEGGIEQKLFTNAPGRQADLAKEVNCFIVPKVIE
jgi:aspartyl-tRNA(Asn)/glutamyl-tRNA(Gln) amidotransferase subunit C